MNTKAITSRDCIPDLVSLPTTRQTAARRVGGSFMCKKQQSLKFKIKGTLRNWGQEASARATPVATMRLLDDHPHIQLSSIYPAKAIISKAGVPSLIPLFPISQSGFYPQSIQQAAFHMVLSLWLSAHQEVEGLANFLIINSEGGPQGFPFFFPF